MNKYLPLLWALGFLLLFSACKKQSIPVSSAPTPKASNKINAENLDFKNFSARGRVQLEETNGSKVASNLTLRIRRDSLIWISVVPALGIEVARVRISQDSVHMVNRLEKTFFAGDYSLIRKRFQVDLTFEMIQSLLLGNYLSLAPETILETQPLHHTQQEKGTLLLEQFVDPTDRKLRKLVIQDQQTRNVVTVNYDRFESVDGRTLARTASILMQQPKNNSGKGSGAALEYSRIELQEARLAFPFSIPAGYTRK